MGTAQDTLQSPEASPLGHAKHALPASGSDKGIFTQMLIGLVANHGEEKTIMIDTTYFQAHRTASSVAVKRGTRTSGQRRTNGGMNTNLHAFCDSQARPLNLFVTARQASDYIGTRALLISLPNIEWLLGDRGFDADWFKDALKGKGIGGCIPGCKQRKKTVRYDKRRYRRCNRIEIIFSRLEDARRVATR